MIYTPITDDLPQVSREAQELFNTTFRGKISTGNGIHNNHSDTKGEIFISRYAKACNSHFLDFVRRDNLALGEYHQDMLAHSLDHDPAKVYLALHNTTGLIACAMVNHPYGKEMDFEYLASNLPIISRNTLAQFIEQGDLDRVVLDQTSPYQAEIDYIDRILKPSHQEEANGSVKLAKIRADNKFALDAARKNLYLFASQLNRL